METSLHRQLKSLYCADSVPGEGLRPERQGVTRKKNKNGLRTQTRQKTEHQEVRVDRYRIDAVHRGRLIEIQQASLGALRDKVRTLLETHEVMVVKPLAARKLLIRKARVGGAVLSTRYSPRHETIADLFSDLVHFVGVFPHPRLTLEVVLTVQEEHRVPVRKRRFRGPDFRVIDRFLVGIEGRVTLKDRSDLAQLLPTSLAESFSTEEIAREADMPRWLAQKMAYCLRKTGALETVGKRGNAWLYRRNDDQMDEAAPARKLA
jgi:hypothetical protein